MEDTSTCSFQATHSQASSESSSTYLKPHEDQTSTTTESTSLLQRPPSMLTEASELSRLEQLPPELRLSILTTLDLNQLKTLIKSSPTFYQQYQYDHRCILGSALHTTLGPVALDAYAVYLTSTVKFYHDYPKVRVPKFLKDYQSLRSSPDSLSWEQNLTESEMSGLAMFHLSFIQPLIEKYKNWAMTNIANDFEEQKKTAHAAPLSSTEQLRIMRALYRFQLWCNLFGGFSYMCDREGPPYMFFSLYEPWEVEEISSVHLFATSGFQTDLPHYMYNVSARFFAIDGFYAESGPSYPGAFHEERCLKVKCIIHGVNILPSTSTQIKTLYVNLFNTLQESWFDSDRLSLALRQDTQVLRRTRYPSVRDQRERDQEPLPFRGDDITQPPVGWTHTWRETYSNLFGAFMPDSHAEWGLMMWDEPRFRDLQGYEVVWYTCKDPRERFRDHEDDDQD
ncbi:hypothetical protein CEP52_006534 [Fusarium oligoseptatum]|uniref:F-box domain-containing protein n=1 Tax=Fusarium oligoseptatum TaxID=2604345 RepID=A0A428TST5_9HYPO|nr:hypothetical protein CEP52_006534 [Fusarium oligoseptatum]